MVKKLDIIANEAFITALKRCKKVCVMVRYFSSHPISSGCRVDVVRLDELCDASEENEQHIEVEGSLGKYVAVFDPLDGSSNIDANVSIGRCISSQPLSMRPFHS